MSEPKPKPQKKSQLPQQPKPKPQPKKKSQQAQGEKQTKKAKAGQKQTQTQTQQPAAKKQKIRIGILGGGPLEQSLAQYWLAKGNKVKMAVSSSWLEPKLKEKLPKVTTAILKGHDLKILRARLLDRDLLVMVLTDQGNKFTPETYHDTYVLRARAIASAVNTLTNLKQVICLSTIDLYGDVRGHWVTEATPVKGEGWRYKLSVETERTLLKLNTPQRQVCILRLGLIYESHQQLYQKMRSEYGRTLPGDGRRVMNWIHHNDLLAAINFIQEQRLSGIYNLTNGDPIEERILLESITNKYCLKQLNWNPQKPVQGLSMRVSNQKLITAGYVFQHPRLLPWKTDPPPTTTPNPSPNPADPATP